ncbi:MAG TPA: ATP-binding protein [Malonomonas sp.]
MLVIIAVLPAMMLLFYNGFEQRRQSVAAAKQNLQLLVHSMAEAQEDLAISARQLLSTLSLQPEILSLNPEASNKILRLVLENNPEHKNILLVGADGVVLAAGQGGVGIDLSDRKHVRGAFETNDFVAGEYIIARVGEPVAVFPFAFPVRDRSGQPVAVLTTVVRLDQISRNQQLSDMPKNLFIAITDHQGIRLHYFPPKEHTNPIGEPIKSSNWDEASKAASPGIFINTGSDGTRRIFAFEQVRLAAGAPPYLYIWAGVPESHILAPVNARLYRNILILLLTTSGALVLAALVGKTTLVTPISTLVETTREYAQGHLGTRIGKPSKVQEFAALTEAFHDMADSLNLSQATLKENEALEALIAEISTRFVQFPSSRTDQGIDLALKDLGEFAGVDRSYIFQLSADRRLMDNTNEWCAEGVNPRKENLQGIVVEELSWAMNKILNDEFFYVPSVAKMPPEAAKEKEHWLEQGIRSLITVPIRITGKTIGFLGFDEVRSEKQWREKDIALLQTVGNIFGNAIENQHTDNKLRAEQFRLSEIIRGTNIGTWEWNVQSGELICNERWAKIIGYRLRELAPLSVTTWTHHLHPEDQQERTRLLEQHFHGELEYFECECRVQHKNGEWIWVVERGQVSSWTAAGTPMVMFGTCTDINERKRLEAERQTIEKLNTVGTLAGGIAHDFNNILAGIYGNISLAKRKLPPGHPTFKYFDAVDKSMSRATLLTNQLLTFAKGGAPVVENLNLDSLVEEIVQFNLSGSKVRAEFSYAEDLWPAEVDQGQIQQVFSNLTINAMQSMPEGGHLYIRMENASITDNSVPGLAEGKYLRITVRDEGVGISPDHLGRIFEPYFTTKQAGSGLGLATVYSIVNRHGGHINVVSGLDQGTTFTLYLPASEIQRLPTDLAESELSPLQKSCKVLVMDDEEIVRETLSMMLEELSCSVESTVDGQQAMRLYQQALKTGKSFDLVILDLTIPGGIGGLETAKRLLELDPEARILISSGYAEDPVMANYAEYGIKGVIPKPYDFNRLSKAVAGAL